jgi:hypothetical protein
MWAGDEDDDEDDEDGSLESVNIVENVSVVRPNYLTSPPITA